jgi:MFS family permease
MIACSMLSSMAPATPFSWLFTAYVLFGLGFGLVNAPITNAAVSGMPRAQAGVASAIASTSRQVGSTLGVAVVGALVTSRLHGSVQAGFSAASHVAWWTLVASGAVVLILGVLATTRRATESARRIATELNPEVLGPQPAAR